MNQRILLVEGNTPGCHLLAHSLGCHGYEVEISRSAREAFLLAQTGRWDAVVMNIGLPEMNGVELYSRSSCDSGRECLPVIFISDYAEQHLLQALRAVPANAEPAKPCGALQFLKTLEQSLRSEKFRASTPC